MRPTGFFREVARRAFHAAWHLSHKVHFLIVLAFGAAIFLGLHFEEHELIVLPFAALAIAFLCSLLWFAFVMFREATESGAERAAELLGRIRQLETALAPPEISADAIRLLTALTTPETNGSFYYFRMDNHGDLRVGGQQWLTDAVSHRDLKHWDAVLEELLSHNFVEMPRGQNGPIEITDAGYAYLAKIKAMVDQAAPI